MTSNKAGQHRGVFVSFEGGEGAGKTTHIRFLAETLEARAVPFPGEGTFAEACKRYWEAR